MTASTNRSAAEICAGSHGAAFTGRSGGITRPRSRGRNMADAASIVTNYLILLSL